MARGRGRESVGVRWGRERRGGKGQGRNGEKKIGGRAGIGEGGKGGVTGLE